MNAMPEEGPLQYECGDQAARANLRRLVSQLRFEYMRRLSGCDLTDDISLRHSHQMFGQELNQAALDFAAELGLGDSPAADLPVEVRTFSNRFTVRDVAAGGALAGGAVALLNVATATKKSWWFFSKTRTLAAVIGGSVGASALAVSVVAAGLIWFGSSCVLSASRRRRRAQGVFESLLAVFDREVVPAFIDWGEKHIEEAFK